MFTNLKVIGTKCKEFRRGIGLCQHHVAEDTGYTALNISAFENGRNDNARILLWYFEHGMTLDDLKRDENGEKV